MILVMKQKYSLYSKYTLCLCYINFRLRNITRLNLLNAYEKRALIEILSSIS